MRKKIAQTDTTKMYPVENPVENVVALPGDVVRYHDAMYIVTDEESMVCINSGHVCYFENLTDLDAQKITYATTDNKLVSEEVKLA